MLTKRIRTILDAAQAKEKRVGPLEFGKQLPIAKKYLSLLRERKKIEEQLGKLKDELVAAIGEWHTEQCKARDQYEPCILVPAGGDDRLQLLLLNKWTEVRASRETELREILGDDFDRCFEERVSLELAKDITEDPKRLARIVRKLKALAGEEFAEWFVSQRLLAATPEFTKEVPLEPADRERLGMKQVVTIQEKK